MSLNPQAQELNHVIKEANPSVYRLLSEIGANAFFPKTGIIIQSAEAKSADINATIGIALDDEGGPMCLQSISRLVSLDSRQVFPYAHPLGRREVRAAWATAMRVKNPLLANKLVSEPIVTAALTHGLSMTGHLFASPGDTIISPDLYWGNYRLIFSNAYGARIETFKMFAATGGFNVDGLKEQLESSEGSKKIVLLNFPNNPTGYTLTNSEAEQVCAVLKSQAEKGDDILVLCDDAYFGLVYEEGVFGESLFGILADLHENILAIKLDGPTKEDYVWGLRVGFVTFGVKNGTRPLYNALEMKLAGAIRGNISNVSNVGQSLLEQAYSDSEYSNEKVAAFGTLERRYQKVRSILAEHPEYREYFEALPFNSGYFMCVELKGLDGDIVRKRLLSDHSTGVISEKSLLRVAFSSTPYSKLEQVFENIYKAARDVASGR